MDPAVFIGFMEKLTSAIEKAVAPLEDTMIQMGKRGTQKSLISSLNLVKMLKSSATSMILDTFSGVFDLLRLLDPILKPIQLLLRVFVFEILKEFMPDLKKIGDLIIRAAPYIKKAGEYTALFIREGLKILINYIKDYVIGVFQILVGIFKFWMSILDSFFKLLSGEIDIFQFLEEAWEAFLDFVKDIANGIITIIRGFIDVINNIPGVDLDKPGYLHSGTDEVEETGTYWLKRGEEVRTPHQNTEETGNTNDTGINITIQASNSVIMDKERFIDELVDKIWTRL